MGFAKDYLWAKLGLPPNNYWRKILRTGGGYDDGGDKPFGELTWDQVIASTKTGKYKLFEIGAVKDMSLGSFGTVQMQIVGIDADDKADSTGKAPISFITMGCFSKADYPMTSGPNVYWPDSIYHNFLVNDVFPELPQIIRDNIVPVIKYTYTKVNGSMENNVESIETIWAPSVREVFPSDNRFETVGVSYGDVFVDDTSRIKRDSDGRQNWYLRTAATSKNVLRCVRYNGEPAVPNNSTTVYCAVMGFCL